MKLNWGHYMAIAMLSFMVFILSFVYNTFTKDSYDHHLVSETYYKDELNYQKEMEAIANYKKLNTPIKLINTEKGIKVIFPADVNLDGVKGKISFQRASNVNLDFNLPITTLINNELLIPKEKLVNGFYNVKIDWSVNKIQYLLKEKYYY